MRRRASLLSAAVLLLGAAPAVADEKLQPYEATVNRDQAALVADSGIELDHAGFNASTLGEQSLQLAITASQAARLEAKGIDLTAEALPKTKKLATGGDSPNPDYDVFRRRRAPRHRRRAALRGGRQPRRGQAGHDRHLAAREADPGDQDHRRRPQRRRRFASRGPVRRRQPRARVDRRRGRAA